MTFKNQSDLFNYIWETRPHFSELSGEPLLQPNYMLWHHQFMHILPKGTYPKWKLNPDNIMLGLPDEHARQETFPKFIEKRDALKRQYYKKFYNKTF